MKPHIKKYGRHWVCESRIRRPGSRWQIGIGKTPSAALMDYRKRNGL